MVKQIKNIIFNWAGTISDDSERNYEAMMIVMESLIGKRISKKQLKKEFEVPVMNFWHKYIPDLKYEKCKQMYANALTRAPNATLYPDTKKVLEQLHKIDINMIVISAYPQKDLNRDAKNFKINKYFKELNGGIYDKSTIIQDILERNNFELSETIYVGDLPNDIEVAKDAQIKSVILYDRLKSRKELEKYNPDVIISNLTELEEVIK